MDTLTRISALLVSKYNVDPGKINLQATMTDLGLDSLSVAELLFDIEDEFAVEIKLEHTALKVLGDAVALVDGLVAAKVG